jgi:cation diffusion facilitator CzcD-associated flavoprotein CzcO
MVRPASMPPHDPANVLIVGAGPAGLALAACLSERGVAHDVVERGDAVGVSWRNHYHRLHLHTVKHLSTLPGLPFGDDIPAFPSRQQVIDYLVRYAEHFGIEPRFNTEIARLRRDGDEWLAETNDGDIRARRVVLATGLNRTPIRPSFAGEDAFAGRVVHSVDYRTAEPFRGNRVLVVGAGNTGGEIALDLLEHGCTVAMCIRGPLHVIPREFMGRPSQVTGVALRWAPIWFRDQLTLWVSKRAYGDLSEVGLRRPDIGVLTQIETQRKIPLIDIGTIERIRSGDITVYPGIERFDPSGVCFVDGRRDDFDVVVLATGYRSGIESLVEGGASIVDDAGYPKTIRYQTALPGLFTLGFTNVSTGLLRQIGIEAPQLADELARA